MAKDLNRQFLKEHTNGQQTYEKMLNNANHKNANIANILLIINDLTYKIVYPVLYICNLYSIQQLYLNANFI